MISPGDPATPALLLGSSGPDSRLWLSPVLNKGNIGKIEPGYQEFSLL